MCISWLHLDDYMFEFQNPCEYGNFIHLILNNVALSIFSINYLNYFSEKKLNCIIKKFIKIEYKLNNALNLYSIFHFIKFRVKPLKKLKFSISLI